MMIDWLKRYWHKILAFIAFIPVSIRIFLRATPLAISLAFIPIEKHVVSPFLSWIGLGQVSARIFSFGLTSLLFILSWYVGEIIIVLMSMAMVSELYLLFECINNRLTEKVYD